MAAFLTASGAAEFALGTAFSSNHTVERAFSNQSVVNFWKSYDDMFLLAGIIEFAIGLPVLIVSEIQKSGHDTWGRNHGNMKVTFNGSNILVDF